MSEAKSPQSTRALLDADWARLEGYAPRPARRRRWWHGFGFRFMPVVLWRHAHACHAAGWRIPAKLLTMANFVLYGLEAPARLSPGPGFVIFHTQGTILGAGAIGRDVSVYQQVTLGATTPDFAYDPALRPRIEDGAEITAGAKVIGGVTIGARSVVGANAVVLKDVPPDTLAVGVPARLIPRGGAAGA